MFQKIDLEKIKPKITPNNGGPIILTKISISEMGYL